MHAGQSFLSRSGVPVSLRTSGEGRSVLVLHGGAGSASVLPLITALSASRHVVAPVHPGWEGTSRPSELATVVSLADLYLEMLADMDMVDVAVVGSSFGGWIASEMAIRGGNTIGALILTGAVGPVLERSAAASASVTQPTTRPIAGSGPTPAELTLLRTYGGPELSDPSLLQRLSSVAVPALGVWGSHDPVSSPTYGRKYVEAVPKSRFVEVDGGHLPFIDDPTNAIGAMTDFLNDIDRDADAYPAPASVPLSQPLAKAAPEQRSS